MSLRRGFKAEASRITIRLRDDLGIAPDGRLDLDAVSKKLIVPIVPLSHFAKSHGSHVRQLTHVDPGAFSAVTIPCGSGRKVILHNDKHSVARQRSNISHEFAHILLDHPMTLPLDDTGCRMFDRDIEEEANWLAGAMLIPDAAAIRIVRTEMSTDAACEFYGVSPKMLIFRVNATGARIRVLRSQRL